MTNQLFLSGTVPTQKDSGPLQESGNRPPRFLPTQERISLPFPVVPLPNNYGRMNMNDQDWLAKRFEENRNHLRAAEELANVTLALYAATTKSVSTRNG
jgi:hypothetical protein